MISLFLDTLSPDGLDNKDDKRIYDNYFHPLPHLGYFLLLLLEWLFWSWMIGLDPAVDYWVSYSLIPLLT